MAPEYAYHGHFSIKSDIYSFGVLVLEIVSGQKKTFIQDGHNSGDLLSYAWRSWREGASANIIDPFLKANGGGSQQDMVRCIHIALLCVQENPDDRPTMASVVVMLNSFSLTLPQPTEPGFYMSSGFSKLALSNQTERSRSSESLRGDTLPFHVEAVLSRRRSSIGQGSGTWSLDFAQSNTTQHSPDQGKRQVSRGGHRGCTLDYFRQHHFTSFKPRQHSGHTKANRTENHTEKGENHAHSLLQGKSREARIFLIDRAIDLFVLSGYSEWESPFEGQGQQMCGLSQVGRQGSRSGPW
ncbi:Protein kinase superfamily protein [Perilla frutescens var. hirtella]|nr:Protein kinase superfamily protein [Perilla frutescens var. hirtella]